MSWDALLDRLEADSEAAELLARLELDMEGRQAHAFPPAVRAGFGNHLDRATLAATEARVAAALSKGPPRPGMTPFEALCENLDLAMTGSSLACRGATYARHRVEPETAWGAGGEAVRYTSLRSFLQYVVEVDRGLIPPPGPSAYGAVEGLMGTLLARIAALPGETRVHLAGSDLLWLTTDGSEPAPHVRALAAGLPDSQVAREVVRRMALPGYETQGDRRVAMGLVAYRFPVPGPLQRPTMTEALSAWSRWFFPAPQAGPVAGRTRALAGSLDAWAEPLEAGVLEWVHDNVELPLGIAPGHCRLEWWGCFDAYTS